MLDDGKHFRRRVQFGHSFDDTISTENLLAAWKEFLVDKRKKSDVQEFQGRLMDNILGLHEELAAGSWRHGAYEAFTISDPKPRQIHKASVRDRLMHHALYRILSQLLVNVYMNEFDQYAKHRLRAKYYIRYADDFTVLSHDRTELENLIPRTGAFLQDKLKLALHPDKVYIKTFSSGVDFLGWVHFPDHRVLRTATKRRMAKNLRGDRNDARRESYRGMLSHGNAHKLRTRYLGE